MKQKFVEGVGLVPLELDEAAKAYSPDMNINHEYSFGKREGFVAGGIKGMEIQKELDRVEIHTLREALYGAIHQLRQYAHRDEDYRRSIEKYMKILEP